ncbi:MAG: hypothetical protein WBE10_12635, partial [Candidatus Acidiferrum sp.]
PDEHKKSRAMIFTLTTALIIAVIAVWFVLRFYPEKKAAADFFDAVVANDMTRAYQLWKPSPTYRMQDFVADWSRTGYYGPVKSYEIVKAKSPVGSTTSVEIRVAISPFSPMPTANEPEKSQKTKVVTVWVDSKDKSFSFPP